jgi:membrane protease YdiL (CAAX protease family)
MNILGTFKSVLIIARYGVRRWSNQFYGQVMAIWSRKKKTGRDATPRKIRKNRLLCGGLIALLLWASLGESSRVIHNLSLAVQLPAASASPTLEAESVFAPSPADWPAAEFVPAMLSALGLLLLSAVAIGQVFSISTICREGGNSNEFWLFSFPVKARTIYLAKILERAAMDGYTQAVLLPLLLAVFITAGFGWASLSLALIASACVALVTAAITVALEVWLRMRAPARMKDIHALCAVIGSASGIGILLLANSHEPPTWFIDAAVALSKATGGLPGVALAAGRMSAAGIALPMIALASLAILAVIASAQVAQRAVRNGLVVEPSLCRGRRQVAYVPASRRRLAVGMAAKEIKLLLRDRTRFVSVLVLPLLGVAFNVYLRPSISPFHNAFVHTAALAFGIGAFMMLAIAYRALTDEQKTLWLMSSMPKTLDRILLQKGRVWIVLGLFYPIVLLAVVMTATRAWSVENIASATVALSGVLIFAFIAAGLGFLATDVLDPEPRRMQRLLYIYLYQILAGIFLLAIYAPTPLARVSFVAFTAMLAAAIWQKVRDAAPYLLDPTQLPPPRIAASDAIIAVFAFLAIQAAVSGFLAGICKDSHALTAGNQMLIAYLVAGAVVALGSLWSFHSRRLPSILRSVGILRGERKTSIRETVALGMGGGAAAALVCGAYLLLLRQFPSLAGFLQDSLPKPDSDSTAIKAFVIIGVAAAPLFEEFVFRGLLLQSMLRTYPRWLSILASAALFAIIHPPLSVLPVFVLGLATGVVFARTRWLVPCVFVHLVYNAAVIFMNSRLG